jgi:hypothetical protein
VTLSPMNLLKSLEPAERLSMAEQLIKEGREKKSRVNQKNQTFQRTYRDNPVAFAHDCIDWGDGGPTFYQDDVWYRLQHNNRVCVRGPHSLGKTCLSSIAILWFSLTRDGEDWKCPTTAGSWRQLSKYLWPEVHKWARKLRWDKIGREPFDPKTELMNLSMRLKTGEAFAVASNDAELIEGTQGDHVLAIYDESKSIGEPTWNALEGAFAGGNRDGRERKALSCSTPGEPRGRFYDIQSRKLGLEDWDAIAVTREQAIRAGRVDMAWCEQRKKQWGESSQVYINRVLGDFAESSEDVIIPLRWIELANERWETWREAHKPGTLTRVGCDIAGGGGEKANKTVFARRYDDVSLPDVTMAIDKLEYYTVLDPMAATGKIVQRIDQYDCEAVIDSLGIGAGVLSRLREQGKSAVGFSAHERTAVKDKTGRKYYDKRSAAWYGFADLLNPEGDEKVALPPDDDATELTGELTLPRPVARSDGRLQVESKEDLGKRMKEVGLEGRSTDHADAVVMAFFEERRGGWARGPAR